jgi:hypothetical protein
MIDNLVRRSSTTPLVDDAFLDEASRTPSVPHTVVSWSLPRLAHR